MKKIKSSRALIEKIDVQNLLNCEHRYYSSLKPPKKGEFVLKKKQFSKIVKFFIPIEINRAFQTYFIQQAINQNIKLIHTKAYIDWCWVNRNFLSQNKNK